MIENTHKVAKKQWRKWSEQAQAVFNEVYETMRDNQQLFLHPQAHFVTQRCKNGCDPIAGSACSDCPDTSKEWTTTAWNAAWTAACAVDGAQSNTALVA